MALRVIPDTEQAYHLVSFNKEGNEVATANGELESDAVANRLGDGSAGITDVFFLAHGWKGDVPAAIEQFDNWLGAMHSDANGRARAEARAGGFMPLLVGLHWPSQPWGDEKAPAPSPRNGLLGVDENDDVYFFADLIADTDVAREAISRILAAPRMYGDCLELPREVHEAYDTLFHESGLAEDSDLADLDKDSPPVWDAEAVFVEAADSDDGQQVLGSGFGSRLLSPLRQLSFWKMKNRARTFGEGGASQLLARFMREAAPSVRFHLMGHSFGCIVVSAAVQAASELPGWRPVDSLLLVQGALSLWAYAEEVPGDGRPGHFRAIVKEALVRGPIAATTSRHDTAVGRYYPIGARLGSQTLLADTELPKYGAIGAFGIQGVNASSIFVEKGRVAQPFGFAPQCIYNVDASLVIASGDGASGAHNDIVHPEIVRLAWDLLTTT